MVWSRVCERDDGGVDNSRPVPTCEGFRVLRVSCFPNLCPLIGPNKGGKEDLVESRDEKTKQQPNNNRTNTLLLSCNQPHNQISCWPSSFKY